MALLQVVMNGAFETGPKKDSGGTPGSAPWGSTNGTNVKSILECDATTPFAVTTIPVTVRSDSNAANYDANCTVNTGCQTTDYIKIGQITETTIELLINNSQNIGGFQFELSGVTLNAGSGIGGLCEDSGLTVSTGPNGVLGFALDGSVIPSTDGQEVTFTTITYASADGSTICLPNSLIISDNLGASSEGYIVHYQSVCE